jgi:hypothetical protein
MAVGQLMTDWLSASLAAGVLEGAVFASMLVLSGTGGTAARAAVLQATGARITELNQGRPIGRAQAAGAFFKDVVASTIDPRRAVRSSDIEWARAVQKQASDTFTETELKLLYETVEAAVLKPGPVSVRTAQQLINAKPEGPSGGVIAELAAVRLKAFLERELPGIHTAETLMELRAEHRRTIRHLVRFYAQRLTAADYRWTWINLGLALGDAIGRGTALSLLVAVLVTQKLGELGTVVSLAALGGGVLGAIAFAARLLTCLGSVEDAIDRKRTILTRQPLLTVVTVALLVGAVVTGAPAFGVWATGLLGR